MAEDHEKPCDAVEFYRIVRKSFTESEYRGVVQRAEISLRVARIRGLIPWDYEGDRDRALRDYNQEFDWPDPPAYGEAA